MRHSRNRQLYTWLMEWFRVVNDDEREADGADNYDASAVGHDGTQDCRRHRRRSTSARMIFFRFEK